VAGAGPAVNFVMALAWAILFRATLVGGTMTSDGLVEMANAGVQINLMLMALNLLPILPLDGGRIALSLLPHSLAVSYSKMEPYGFMLVILLLATGLLGTLMQPLLALGLKAVHLVVGI
jgi:Zn-dependent protease